MRYANRRPARFDDHAWPERSLALAGRPRGRREVHHHMAASHALHTG